MHQILLLIPFLLHSTTALCSLGCTCDFQTTNCAGLGFKSTPEIDPNVLYLNLSYNNLLGCFLPEDLNILQLVDLSHNSIETAVFPPLYNLQEVNLSWNPLTFVEIDNLESLKKLDVSQNEKFSTIPQLVSDSLEYLDVSNNSLNAFDQNYLKLLTNLRTLVLAHNPIRSIINLGSRTLETLDISGCIVHFIDSKKLLAFPNLIHLKAAHNRNLRVGINGPDVDLKIADFSHSGVVEINIPSLKLIQSIDFSFNKIQIIDGESFKFNDMLNQLNISSNAISTIFAQAFRNNSALTIFNVSHNLVNSIEWTYYLTGVIMFDASFNRIPSLTSIQLKRAVDVDLSHNLIQDLTIDLSTAFPRIEALNLRNNRIGIVGPLKSKTLKRLWLGYCDLNTLKTNTFSQLPVLTFLDLEGNKFVQLDYKVLAQARSLNNVLLGGNLWTCNCKNQDFINLSVYLFVNNSLTDTNKLICDQGQKWVDKCILPKTRKEKTEFDQNVFVWLGIFFLVALSGGLGLLYCKGRNKPTSDETPSPVVHQQSLLRNSSVRRVRSAAEILLHRTSPDESPAYHDYPPPTYDEAILMPPLTETERMTRSMEVLRHA